MRIFQVYNCSFICFLVDQAIAALVCQESQVTVKLPDGNITCVSCPKCPPGLGTTALCGGTVPYNASIECKVCTPEHYSDSFSSESCKPCSACMPDEVMVGKCTKISNTRCSCKPCPMGYYRDQTLSKCLPCSGCCSNALDVVAQCVSQGMPHTQACSYSKSKRCRSKCGYDEITVKMHGGKHRCLPCPVCSSEFGLTKPCGGFLYDEVVPKCEPPTLGKRFINQQGILQSCKNCSPGQEVIVNCSAKSDTICGGCRPGFYFNDLSKSCEECFWCCSYIDSKQIKNCIRKGMLFAESYHTSLPTQFLHVNMKSAQVSQEQGCLMGFLEVFKSPLYVVALAFVMLAFKVISQKRQDCGQKEKSLDVSNNETMVPMPPMKKHLSETIPTVLTSSTNTKDVESEYPIRHNPGHVLFEKTGVELLSLNKNKSDLQHVPCDLSLQAISDFLDVPGFLKDGEVPLSHIIKFISSTKLDGTLKVLIPHGANMVLSGQKWKIILKEFSNNKWVVVSDIEGHGIENVISKSNHVSFDTDHFSTFAVVGYCDKNSLSAFKRMKVVAFCSETRVGEDLVVRLYCFDDCEWSFERLMKKEQDKGGKLMSSIESLDFSVTCEEDVKIVVKDSDGWKLGSSFPMKFSYTSLRNSFSQIPQCDLMFNATSFEGNNTFFVTIALTQSSGQTVMYASTAIQQDPSFQLNVIPNIMNEGVHNSDMNGTTPKHEERKEEAITNVIIQL